MGASAPKPCGCGQGASEGRASRCRSVSSCCCQAKEKKLSYKEQRELDELPKLIAALEDEQAVIAGQLAHPDFYKKSPAEGKRLNSRVAEIESQLLDALEKWEVIEARAKG